MRVTCVVYRHVDTEVAAFIFVVSTGSRTVTRVVLNEDDQSYMSNPYLFSDGAFDNHQRRRHRHDATVVNHSSTQERGRAIG